MAAAKCIWPCGFLVLSYLAPAWADGSDVFTLSAGYSVQDDSNLFRLPDSANVLASTGKASAAEQIQVSTAGLESHITQGLQKFDVDLSVVDNQYRNFSFLNSTATNYAAAWHWSLTPQVRGNLSTTHAETLNSFADGQGANVRNLRTAANSRFDSEYEIDGAWRLLGGISEYSDNSQQQTVTVGNYSTSNVEAGVLRDFTSGSSIAYVLKSSDGQYLNRSLSSAAFLDNRFREVNNQVRAHLQITDKTSADFSAALISRAHANFSQRDYAGENASASVNWLLADKTSLAAGVSRELASYQTADFNYVRGDKVFVTPTWQIGPKTVLRMSLEQVTQDYLGSPTGISTAARQDILSDRSLSITWLASRILSLSASSQSSKRSSSVQGQDYASTTTSISARISY